VVFKYEVPGIVKPRSNHTKAELIKQQANSPLRQNRCNIAIRLDLPAQLKPSLSGSHQAEGGTSAVAINSRAQRLCMRIA
jgi:hypothetical protein